MESRRGRISRGMLPVLGLHVLSEYSRLDRKPPVTAGLILANTLIYLRPGLLNQYLPSLYEVCFNPHLILKNKDLKRFFLSALYHMNEPHLVYNMLSLLWKGIQLESSMGSIEFASMVAELLAMSQGITLLLAKSLLLFFDYEHAYYYEHAVGFSGVLFAMKVVLNSRSSDYTYVHGLVVPTRYAAWAELILIQLFVPGVSFLGHLGGILAGILYLRLRHSYYPDPVTCIFRGLTGLISWPLKLVRDIFQFRRQRISGRGTVGRHRLPTESGASGVWRCSACTYDNSGLLNECEMCGTGRHGDWSSSVNARPLSNAHGISLEELRRRRLERFDR